MADDPSNQPGVWRAVDLRQDPILLLGRRKGNRNIEVLRLEVDIALFTIFRDSCSATRMLLLSTSPRPYEANAEVDSDVQHFELSRLDIEALAHSRSGQPPGPDNTAAIIVALRDAGRYRTMTRSEFEALNNALFYAISWQQPDDSWVSFVRKSNPRHLFKPGLRWLMFDDTLRQVVEQPTFLFESTFDVVVQKDIVAGFSGEAMKNPSLTSAL
jgi:hypothetical protein